MLSFRGEGSVPPHFCSASLHILEESTVSKLRQRMIDDLKLRNYSPCTVVCYVRHVQWFACHFGKSPDQLGLEHIRQYQLHLINQKHASWSTFNQAVCALRFFYKVTLCKDWDVKHIPYGKVPRKLPEILSPGEVLRFLPCVRPLKQRLVLTTCYAAGLRLGGPESTSGSGRICFAIVTPRIFWKRA